MYKPVATWLFICCFMVFMTAQIGAITRLTESGLSITEWKPITGALPPMTAEAWDHAFDLYKQSPEFAARHSWMNLGDFKRIFFWEWLHRLWDRMIGIAFLLPFLWFWYKKRLPPGFSKLLLLIFAVGCAEGFMGWYMVQSGLVHRPSVSHLRLAMHLSLALLIYGAMLWTGLSLYSSPSPNPLPERRGLLAHGLIALLLLAATIIWGAFVAGLHAGLAYNTYPMMNGHWTPVDETFSPVFNAGWVQFTHRYLAQVTGLAVLAFAWRIRSWPLCLMVCVQIALGIATLLSVVWLPLAALHQAGAMILLTLLLTGLRKTASGGEGRF